MTLHWKTMILAIGLPASTLAAIVFGIIPLASSVTALADDVTNTRIEQASLEKQLEDISSIVRQYKKIQSDADRLSTAFVNGRDALSFIETLEATAATTGVTQDINLEAPKAPPTSRVAPTAVTVTLRTEGSFEETFAYLQALERLPVYLLPTNASILRGAGTAGTTTPGADLSLTLNATTYWIFPL